MLTLQFVPYAEIEELGSARRVKKILDLVKDNKIVLLEGKLKKEEEADLIAITMEEIDDKFKGIELAVINPEQKDIALFKKMKKGFINLLLGDRQGFTVIGPASIVKEIKKDPDKIQMFTMDDGPKKKKKRKK
jgi:hypothetical protein